MSARFVREIHSQVAGRVAGECGRDRAFGHHVVLKYARKARGDEFRHLLRWRSLKVAGLACIGFNARAKVVVWWYVLCNGQERRPRIIRYELPELWIL